MKKIAGWALALALAGCGSGPSLQDGGETATEREACEHLGHCMALDFNVCMAIAEGYEFPGPCLDALSSLECEAITDGGWASPGLGCWEPCYYATPMVCVLNSGYRHCVEIEGALWMVYGACNCIGTDGHRFVGSCVDGLCRC